MLALLRGTCTAALGLVFALSPRGLARATFVEPTAETTIELGESEAAPLSFSLARPPAPPVRAHFGHADLYVPTFFHPHDGTYDLLVHFHGMGALQEANVEQARLNAVVVSVNLGAGSGPYEQAFRDPHAFPRLVAEATRLVARSRRAAGAHLGRVAVSAWSAGYGAVASLLRQPDNVGRIDAVLLGDGPHSDWAGRKQVTVSDAPLEKYARVAEAAEAGDKLFAITHSSIETDGYPSTTQTVSELLRMVGIDKTPHDAVGPRQMHEIYEADRGDFHVKGYTGRGVPDHIDHIKAMGQTLLPYLERRWDR